MRRWSFTLRPGECSRAMCFLRLSRGLLANRGKWVRECLQEGRSSARSQMDKPALGEGVQTVKVGIKIGMRRNQKWGNLRASLVPSPMLIPSHLTFQQPREPGITTSTFYRCGKLWHREYKLLTLPKPKAGMGPSAVCPLLWTDPLPLAPKRGWARRGSSSVR